MTENKSKKMKIEPKRSKRLEEKNKKRKQNEDSSDSDQSYYSTESDDEMDVHEYRKFLSKIFPSKHLNQKIKAGEKMKAHEKSKQVKQEVSKEEEEYEEEEDDEEWTEEEEEEEEVRNKKSSSKKKSKHFVSEEESEEDISSETEEDDESYEEDSDLIKTKSNKKYNIIFTIGNVKDEEYNYDDEDEDEDWETDNNSTTENEDDPLSSDSEEEAEEAEEEREEGEEKIQVKRKGKRKEKGKTPISNKKKEKVEKLVEKEKSMPKQTEIEDNKEFLRMLKEMHEKCNNTAIGDCIKICEENIKKNQQKIEKKAQKYKDRNERIFRKILSDKNTMNDFAFFNKMDIEHQKKIIKELREINRISRIEKPYRLTLLESDIPVIFKAAAMKKVSSLRYMEPGSGEFYKIKNWVDTFMRIPFGKIEQLPLSIEDGVDQCHEFMENAKNTLDNAVYGLNDAKMQIMQLVGQLITNPKAIGTAIAIHGPPGTGKTSLVKEGISKILNRPFSFIALGGATDSSFLEGHSYTYEGSTWGKIVQILMDSKCMNPVIYFDELDKISDTPKGEEIAGILTHLTDTSQNSQFHDKYFSEIDFDLSKCLFIFSYNDEYKVNPILRDRMYRIQTKGYESKQKITIATQHLLPKIREQVKFNAEDILLPDESLQYIIEHFCNKEDGVRNLKRCLEIIYTKLNLYRLMKPGTNLFEEDMSLDVVFPFTVTKKVIDKLIKINKDNKSFSSLYI